MRRAFKATIWTGALIVASPILLVCVWWMVIPMLQSWIQPKLVYEIPNGYLGWVTVDLNHSECPSIKRNHALVYYIDAKGHGCTADPVETGWRTVVYDYMLPDGSSTKLEETAWGKGGMIWATQVESDGKSESTKFFVGTEKQFHDLP
jgi:hypothetical protein